MESHVEAVTWRADHMLIPRIAGDDPLWLECKQLTGCVESDTTPRSDGADSGRGPAAHPPDFADS